MNIPELSNSFWNTFIQSAVISGYNQLIYLLVYSIAPYLILFNVKDRLSDTASQSLNQETVFDFIIVGGGSAGCVLANRLSENFTVLLLEAGGFPSPIFELPIITYSFFHQPGTDWKYYTEPQKNTGLGLVDNKIYWPAGKVLGGGSNINGMICIRGNVQGFDDLAQKTGDPRWSMANVLSYYKKLENYKGWYDTIDHGHDGLLSIEKSTLAPFVDNLIRAGEELGYPERDPNPNGPNTEGFAKMDSYFKDGRRSDNFHNFLEPVLNRPNLTLRRFAYVTKILFKSNTTAAYGVEYLHNGKSFTATVKKEVILSAGSLGTPQILMLSGIGPQQHLSDIGIPTLLNLPVGNYLQDKYGVLVGPFIVSDGKSVILARDLTLPGLIEWYTSGTGPLKTGLAQATYAHISPSAKADGRTAAPDVHTYVLSVPFDKELSYRVMPSFNWEPETMEFLSKGSKFDSFIQMVALERPMSKGVVRLKDTNPLSHLIIDPMYYEDSRDFTAIVEGVQFAVNLVENTTAFKEINGHLLDVPFPGCEAEVFKTTKYYECLVRHIPITAYKYSGTAPIGKDNSDPDAVVDTQLRVLGTTKLRIVDGSVLQHKYMSPNDITCRTIGLLAADIILEDVAK